MDVLDAIILGVVEGITEFLPISSTGHLILASTLLKLEQTEFLKSFEIVIQLGAISSVVVLYWKKMFLDKEIFKKVAVALLPTLVIGAIFYKIVKNYLMESNAVIIWALILGGLGIIIFEFWHKEGDDAAGEIEDISFKQALAVGFFQSIAIIPGVSRSASTIIGGLILGLKRRTIVEFSFLLAVPTMLAASTLDIYKNYQYFSLDQFEVLAIGFVVSFIIALLSIKWLLGFIKGHSFIGFGIYRVLAAVLFWLFILR